MEMVKCETCGKEFETAHAMKVHAGRAHGEKKVKAASKPKPVKAAKGKAKATKKATLACDICGKTFSMAAHLARHKGAAHGAAKPKKARKIAKIAKIAKAAPAVSMGIDVRVLSVDQLLALKSEVDARLADIVKQMRAAKVAL